MCGDGAEQIILMLLLFMILQPLSSVTLVPLTSTTEVALPSGRLRQEVGDGGEHAGAISVAAAEDLVKK